MFLKVERLILQCHAMLMVHRGIEATFETTNRAHIFVINAYSTINGSMDDILLQKASDGGCPRLARNSQG